MTVSAPVPGNHAFDSDLFVVAPLEAPLPEPAQIHRSVVCDACGESVSEHRVVERDGRRLCIPCAKR